MNIHDQILGAGTADEARAALIAARQYLDEDHDDNEAVRDEAESLVMLVTADGD